MMNIDTLHPLSFPENFDTSRFIIMNSLTLVHLYARHAKDILPSYKILKSSAKDYDVYLPYNTPELWQ
jgi:hypothetical protein